MTKDRKKEIDSFWRDSIIGKYWLHLSKQEDPKHAKEAERICHSLWNPQKPWILIGDLDKEFAKEFSNMFKDHSEWEEYVDLLYLESKEMNEAMQVAADANLFIFQAEVEILNRNRTG